MLYRRGWPTSVVLLLLVVVAQLSLPLGRHPSLCLHHLLDLVGATRWLVSLAGVEALQVRAREGARIPKVAADRVVARGAAAHARICRSIIV